MIDRRPESILWVLAISAFAVGIAWAAISFSEIRGRLRKSSVYVENTKKLLQLRQVAGRDEALIQAFDQLPDPHPAPIAQLLRDALPGQKYDIREPPPVKATEGWTVRRTEVSFPEVRLVLLASFLAKAEAQRPPWRLAECTIRSLSTTGGIGQVTLTVEALEKAASAASGSPTP